MGFRLEPTIYNLNFQGTPLDGLHVRMGCCTLGEYNEILYAAVMEGEPDKDGNVRITADMLRKNDRIIEIFLNHLISWDLEDMAGRPVPTTRDGINSEERTLTADLISSWQIAMVTVPNRSKPELNSGVTSEEQSLGLGNISESPQN